MITVPGMYSSILSMPTWHGPPTSPSDEVYETLQHEHRHPPWDELRGVYDCPACPGGYIACDFCQAAAEEYTPRDSAGLSPVFACSREECKLAARKTVYPLADTSPTPRLFEAAAPVPELCCEQYYGIACPNNCRHRHHIKGSRGT